MRSLAAMLWLGTMGATGVSLASGQQLPPGESEVLVPQPRIVGGVNIGIEQVPATAALLKTQLIQRDGNLFQAQFCGGTVIAPLWVITAAHCVVNEQGIVAAVSSIQVLTGSSNLNNPVNQPIAVTRIIAHPSYVDAAEGFDIALLELEYDAMVEPIVIDMEAPVFNELAFIAGWGAVTPPAEDERQRFPAQLQGTLVRMVPGDECARLFPAYGGLVGPANICAGVESGGRDSCQGDSGGPLYRMDQDTGRVKAIAGITSWGFGCGAANFPGVYTLVNAYTNWIESSIASSADPRIPNAPSAAPIPNDDVNLSDNTDTDNPVQTPAPARSGSGGGAILAGLLPLIMLVLWRLCAAALVQRQLASGHCVHRKAGNTRRARVQ